LGPAWNGARGNAREGARHRGAERSAVQGH
jgi:hypothetical protein